MPAFWLSGKMRTKIKSRNLQKMKAEISARISVSRLLWFFGFFFFLGGGLCGFLFLFFVFVFGFFLRKKKKVQHPSPPPFFTLEVS